MQIQIACTPNSDSKANLIIGFVANIAAMSFFLSPLDLFSMFVFPPHPRMVFVASKKW